MSFVAANFTLVQLWRLPTDGRHTGHAKSEAVVAPLTLPADGEEVS